MTTRGASRAAAAATAAVIALAAAGCGSGPSTTGEAGSRDATSSGASPTWAYGDPDPASSARTIHVAPADQPGLPPRSFEGLRVIYSEPLQALGMRLTRASVVQLTTGPHLQVYVEPMGPTTNAEYVARIITLAKAVAPLAFATWPALATIDACQEPPPGVDDSKEPPPETVLFMTRAQSAQVQWDSATVTELRRVIAASSGGELQVNAAIAADAAWMATAP